MALPFLGQLALAAAPAIIGGAASAFGASKEAAAQEQTNVLNEKLARENREFQSAEALRQMEFQASQVKDAQAYNERLANSSYQRAMADMRAAGLNPILAYRQGGAPTAHSPVGSGAAGSGSVLPMKNPWSGFGQSFSSALTAGVSSGLSAARVPSEIRKLEAEVNKVFAETRVQNSLNYLKIVEEGLLRANINVAEAQPGLIEQQIRKMGADVEKTRHEVKILVEALKQSKASGFSAEVYEEFLRQNPWLRKVEAIGKALGVVAQGKGLLK